MILHPVWITTTGATAVIWAFILTLALLTPISSFAFSMDACVAVNRMQPPLRTVALLAGRHKSSCTRLFAEIDDITKMRIGEIRNELENYGISTKSFLEKREMIDALKKARAEGKKPIKSVDSGKSESEPSQSTYSQTSASAVDRNQQFQEVMEKAQTMKVSDLKKELQARGIPTKSFLEKSEFVKAFTQAMIDNVSQKSATSNNSIPNDEPYDPTYRDVVMQKLTADPRLLQGTVIDVTVRR